MSLEKRLFKKQNLIGNFNNEVVELGKVYQVDDGDFTPLGNLNEFDSSINLSAITEHSAPANREIKTSKDVQVNTNAEATSAIGADEIEVVVASKRNGIIMLESCVTATLKSQLIKAKLLAIWRDQKFDRKPLKYAFVTEVLKAASGTVLITTGNDTRILFGHEGPLSIGAVPALLKGRVRLKSSSGTVNHIISTHRFQPLWSGLRIKNNGDFEKLG